MMEVMVCLLRLRSVLAKGVRARKTMAISDRLIGGEADKTPRWRGDGCLRLLGDDKIYSTAHPI